MKFLRRGRDIQSSLLITVLLAVFGFLILFGAKTSKATYSSCTYDCPVVHFEWSTKVCPADYPNKSQRHEGYCYKGNSPDWPKDYKIMDTQNHSADVAYDKSQDPNKCHRPSDSTLQNVYGMDNDARSAFKQQNSEWKDSIKRCATPTPTPTPTPISVPKSVSINDPGEACAGQNINLSGNLVWNVNTTSDWLVVKLDGTIIYSLNVNDTITSWQVLSPAPISAGVHTIEVILYDSKSGNTYNNVQASQSRQFEAGTCSEPTPVSSPTPEPTTTPDPSDLCPNVDGVQTSIPDGWFRLDGPSFECRQFQYGGPQTSSNNTPSDQPQGQVLGASTMAGAGTFAETFYQAIMGIGATLTAFGAKGLKKGKKDVKKVKKTTTKKKVKAVKKSSKKTSKRVKKA